MPDSDHISPVSLNLHVMCTQGNGDEQDCVQFSAVEKQKITLCLYNEVRVLVCCVA